MIYEAEDKTWINIERLQPSRSNIDAKILKNHENRAQGRYVLDIFAREVISSKSLYKFPLHR